MITTYHVHALFSLTQLYPTSSLDFTRALTCLTKFGEDIDFKLNSKEMTLNCVNGSRTACGTITFYPRFFLKYSLENEGAKGKGKEREGGVKKNGHVTFGVKGKVSCFVVDHY